MDLYSIFPVYCYNDDIEHNSPFCLLYFRQADASLVVLSYVCNSPAYKLDDDRDVDWQKDVLIPPSKIHVTI